MKKVQETVKQLQGRAIPTTAHQKGIPSLVQQQGTPSTGHGKVVVFRVGGELFAAPVQSVERVLRHQVPRPIPDVPAWIDGVIEYRDRVVPVINLRRRFELPDGVAHAGSRLLVMNAGGEWIAATADAVLEVSAGGGEVTPPPPFFNGLAGEYLTGLLRRGDTLVLVLDVERLLTTTERLRLADVTAGLATTPTA